MIQFCPGPAAIKDRTGGYLFIQPGKRKNMPLEIAGNNPQYPARIRKPLDTVEVGIGN